jgi:hypothetical protein
MFEQYKKTFWGVQAVIALVTIWTFFACERRLAAAAVFFVMMQVGGVLGAAWANSLKVRLQRRSS